MTATGKVTNFVKQVLAQLKGDENQAIALKNARKADSAINAQLASLRSRLVDLENSVEDAQENYGKAKYPKNPITDNKGYIDDVERAYKKLQKAEEDIEDVNVSIEFYEALQKEINEEETVTN